ncbi:hypothetical protein [Clavibacter sp.]|uniref:hypothetical protein n=1 Tax=Clavibacter sp. TaxID=1871044 RepID=UPI0019B0459E|nr:hypothetical protein [Clavibacter sp.]MBD5381957.1 hypothetical protein [Clavibacter sp.]
MIREVLKIRTDMGMGDNNPSFHDIEITEYNYVGSRMGIPTLTATLMWESCLDNEWTSKEYVVLNGERFYIRHTPTSSKSNTDFRYKHDLTFVSEYAEILGNTYFVDAVPDLRSGIECQTRNKPCSNNTVFTFYGTVSEFVDRLNCVFIHAGVGDSILKTKTYITTLDQPIGDGFCAMVDPYGDYDKDKTYEFSFEDKKIWEAITEAYNKTEIPFERRGRKIIFGAVANVVSHEFEYGYDNELLSVTKTNANAQVINKITMLGSDENIPYYYPNESEYGHIVIDTPADNKALRPEMITITHQTSFLSTLREGEYFHLHKRPSSVGSVLIDNDIFYTGFHSINNLTESKSGTIHTLKYGESPNNETYWYFKVKIKIEKLGDFKVSKAMGCVWRTNDGRATIQNLVGSNLYIDKLIRIVSADKTTDVTNYANRNADGTYNIRFSVYGNYEIIFRVPVRMYNREDSFFMIRNIEMEYLRANSFYWTIGTNGKKEYDSLDSIGIHLNVLPSDNMIGDCFGWASTERIPLQDHLMPPKYIETLGQERFYKAINLNLVEKSDEVYVEGVDNYSHVGLAFNKTPNLSIGDKITVSVDDIDVEMGAATEFSITLRNDTDKTYLSDTFVLSKDKKYATLTVIDTPKTENARIYLILYAGKAGKTLGNLVKYSNIMVVRGSKAQPWHSSALESGLTEYIDPDTMEPYLFPNPYIEGAPSEHIYKDENIKPAIEGVTNTDGALFGVIADIAYDTNDNDLFISDASEEDKNDSSKYEHSYFYIKLNIFSGQYGFDLFKSASHTDPMTIQMTSGNCNGCKFKIQVKESKVDGFEVWENPVQVGSDGNIVDGDYTDKININNIQAYQQNTEKQSIWICVQKDAETFGVIMPNQSNNFKPQIGDTFNIINITLPESYLRFAEKRLEEDGIRFMADNNEDKFTFDISASRIFFAERPDILAQIDEYSKIKVRYNGEVYEQYVNQITIDCKDNEALPNITLGLTDTLAVGQSFVEQVAERASSLIANPTTMGTYFGQNNGAGGNYALSDARYINKQKNDRTPYKLSSDMGFEVGEFVSGASGGIFFRDPETGQTYIEVDKIKARMKAIFAELEVAKENSIGGKFDITPGGGIDISFVEELTDSYRCYFKAKDEDKGADCRFVVGDQARCQEVNIANGTSENASNRYYWRLVTAVNNDEGFIELSKSDCDIDSDAPMAGDTVVQLGNRNIPERRSAIILSTTDAFAPCVTLYNNVGSGAKKSEWYSLDGKSVIEYGVDKTKNPPRPFFHCYGDMYVGNKDKSRYLQYTPEDGLLVKGTISSASTIADENGNETLIEDYVKQKQKNATIDLTNEVVAVACDSNGNPISSTLPTSNIKVFEGSSLGTGWSYTIMSDGCSAEIIGDKIVINSLTSDTASVNIEASKADYPTLTATMSVYKVKPGANGTPAETFSIFSDVDNITKSFPGELSVDRIGVLKYRQIGNNAPVRTPQHNLYYQRIGEDDEEILILGYGWQATKYITITDKTESVILTLKSQDNGTVLDTERIPVLIDASDIEIGTRNIIPGSNRVRIDGAKQIYSAVRVNTTVSFWQDEVYSLNIGGIYIYGQPVLSGRFMVKIYNNAVTKEVGSLTNIDPLNPRGIIKITADSGSKPWLYLYAGDEESKKLLNGVTTDGVTLDFEKVQLVKGNVPLSDWTAAPEDTANAIGKFDYLAEALKDNATINGGLILASTISLGKDNTDSTTQYTWSGLNGITIPTAVGGGIAAWYGGDMYDLAEYYDWDEGQGQWVAKTNNGNIPQRIAKGVDRMDGSGYRANGNLFWDADGNTTYIGDIIARGTFRGLRRRYHTVITKNNISDYSYKSESGTEYINMDATGALVDFRYAPTNPIYLPESDLSYLGETIIIINAANQDIRLHGLFRMEGTTNQPTTSITLKNNNVLQATFKLANMERGIDGEISVPMWIYEIMQVRSETIPSLPDTDKGPLDPIV